MKYLIIKNNSEIVFGDNGSVIYNLSSKNYFSLDIVHTEILKEFVKGTNLESIEKSFDKKISNMFINSLIENEIAEISDVFYCEEKTRVGYARPVQNLQISTCFIELPASCKQSCSNCQSMKLLNCLTCSLPTTIKDELDLDYYKELLSDLLNTTVQTVIFHGGDPLNFGETLLELLEYTRAISSPNLQIIIKTNGASLNYNIADYLIKYKVNLLIVFNESNINNNGFLSELSELTQYLLNNEIGHSCNIVLNSNNDDESIIEKLNSYNFQNLSISTIINETENFNKYASIQFTEKFSNNFNYNKSLHPCLNGVLAITVEKEIIPCPSMNEYVLLDLKKSKFIQLFNNKDTVNRFWRFSLDKIDKCKSCKMRYSCVDCRSIEEKITNNIYKKKICYLDR